jgi:hypothetical protein
MLLLAAMSLGWVMAGANPAILVGFGSTQNVGEQSPAFVLAADARRGPVQVEGWLTTAAKIESKDGWASRLGADVWSGPFSIGAHWAHRETSLWHKDRLFVRASAAHGPLRLLCEVAPDSPNREVNGEVRIRFAFPAFGTKLVLEPRYFVESHSQVDKTGEFGWGASLLGGIGW